MGSVTQTPRVLMICDAGPEIGIGHLMRCVALAEEFQARGFEVLFSTESPEGPYQSIGRYTLEQSEEIQRFLLPGPTDAAWIKLRILSSYGGAYAALGEFNAFVLPRGPLGMGTPQLTPPGKP